LWSTFIFGRSNNSLVRLLRRKLLSLVLMLRDIVSRIDSGDNTRGGFAEALGVDEFSSLRCRL
uniref:Transposase n=1 Tax=Haemonchus placei TaxID=6290 RepID=A0A0N4WII9_HAEPC